MNKKMFIICSIFVLTISCKNYAASDKGVKGAEQNLEKKVKGFLDTKKEELIGGLKTLGVEISPKVKELMQADEGAQGQAEEQVAQGPSEGSKLQEEIKQKIKELKEKIDKLLDEKAPIGKYCEHEEEIKKIRKQLEDIGDKLEDKGKLEIELEELEDSLTKKKETRKKALEKVKEKLNEFKEQIGSASGQSDAEKVKEQGKIGLQAWQCVNSLGLGIAMDSKIDNNSGELANKVINDSLKKIEEELNKIGEEKKE
ncbi:Erp27 protein (plasmid) [Borreliella burgdorferi 29805]|uniref:hypothetical protein n=1 Tax=Borreliella burgdorferi TaxID=139 RepID=UPI00016C4AAD|nr:hypothetical protein [Borreliella burgdorferi]ACM10182.1 Erp27 protein [Borreliella burgdorferi 72a]ACO38106.1 Erp27 protein [Borreliella burgdorferi 29805]MCD2318878.1 hypothetical protein [Borreliella burgdorferi]MCD2320239.1 hypothetical protein [Borreliella burgdorferi]MCD2376697.1 hypothetical protein [Borreliella burgdorferi]